MPELALCREKLQEINADFVADARQKHIPIIRDESLKLLLQATKLTDCKRILEIGTAIGYSSSWLAVTTGAIVDTVEIDEERFEKAKKLWAQIGVEDRINGYLTDAEDILPELAKKYRYDFVFIDAAKSKYSLYLDTVYDAINTGGVIFADNVYYLGLVKGDAYPPHKHRTIVVNMRKFLAKISDEKLFDTKIYDLEDGTAVCVKK